METVVENIYEARRHFTINDSPINCRNKKKERVLHSLEEAEVFFAKKIRNKIRPIVNN